MLASLYVLFYVANLIQRVHRCRRNNYIARAKDDSYTVINVFHKRVGHLLNQKT